jgi:hypothetical protein
MADPKSRCLIAFTMLLLASAAHADAASPEASGIIHLAAAGDRPAVPVLPAQRPEPASALSRTRIPAARESDTLLDVKVPGRFSVRAQSSNGVALQLVDMIAGPGDVAGAAGSRDGRIDILLDKGTYKLHSTGAAGATGEATLSALPFREMDGASSALIRGGQVSNTLADLQQRSYWIAVDQSRRVSVEAVGRALQDLRLWSNGTDLVDLNVSQTTIERKQAIRLRAHVSTPTWSRVSILSPPMAARRCCGRTAIPLRRFTFAPLRRKSSPAAGSKASSDLLARCVSSCRRH